MVKLLIVGAARAPAHTRRAARGTLAAQKVGLSALPLYPALSQDNPAPAAVPPAAALSAAADRLAALLTVALVGLGAVAWRYWPTAAEAPSTPIQPR